MKKFKRPLHSAFRGLQVLTATYLAFLFFLFVLSRHKTLTADESMNVMYPLTQGHNLLLTPLYIAITYTVFVYFMSLAVALGHYGYVVLYKMIPPTMLVVTMGVVAWSFKEVMTSVGFKVTWSGITIMSAFALIIFCILLCIGLIILSMVREPRVRELHSWILVKDLAEA